MISIGNLQINKLCLGDVEVSKAYLGDVEVYNSTPQPVGKYMTMTVLDGDAGTTIAPTVTGTLSPNLQYRVNNGSWSDFLFGTTAAITAQTGDTVQWKGVNESGISTSDSNYLKFSISGNPVAMSGNVMSLIDGVGDALVIPNNYCFYKMFSKSNVKTVTEDFLPATTISRYCYVDLFSESLLENSPSLPALTMQDNCYRGMFYGCQHFTQAPALPATILAQYCYQGMFQNCTSLVNPPELPATSLQPQCYYLMFSGCTSLTTTPELPATTLVNYCYENMFSGCTSLTTVKEIKATKLANYCCYYMFSRCTSLTTAPSLPCTNLYDYCYEGMFSGCSKLTSAPSLPATTLKNRCYKSMFKECNRLVQAPKLNATTLADGCYDSMFFNCSSLTTPPELPATVIKDSCYYQMFFNCSNLLTAPELPGENLENHCYERMFMGCIRLEHAPVLNCTTLVDNCYREMFKGCWELNYVKSMATEGTIKTDGTAPLALQNWLYGVSDTGTFEKPAGVSYVTGDSGIPEGWTVVEEKPKPEGKYMTITVSDGAEGTTISPTVKGTLSPNLQYRINNNGDWTDFIVGTTADIHLVSGDWVQFKGNNTSGLSTSLNDYIKFNISGNTVSLSGNIMSIIDGVGDTLVIPSEYCFNYLFSGSSVKSVTSDFLPATTLKKSCYYNMFKGCTSLVNAPELPANNIEGYCYYGMFSGCTALKQAPEILPASSVGRYSCGSMFSGCTSLTQAPKLTATSIDEDCYSGMFSGCTSLTKAPVLPAVTLKDYCYSGMFSGCTSLNYVKCNALYFGRNSLSNWLYKVASSGTFEKLYRANYERGDSGIPNGWNVIEFN